jgi:hypothetical protein
MMHTVSHMQNKVSIYFQAYELIAPFKRIGDKDSIYIVTNQIADKYVSKIVQSRYNNITIPREAKYILCHLAISSTGNSLP